MTTEKVPAPSPINVDRFVVDLHSALELRRQFYQVTLDEEFERQGGTIIYAIDSNLLNLHFQTFENEKHHFLTSCGTFSGPEGADTSREDKAKITQVVASYLVRTLTTSNRDGPLKETSPLIMLPGHSEEARTVYDRLIDEFYSHRTKKRSARNFLLGLLDDLENLKSADERIDYIKQKEDELHSALFGLEAPHDKFREFNQLLAQPRLLGMKRATNVPELAGIKNPFSGVSVFADYESFEEERGSEGTAEWWAPRLEKRKRVSLVEADKTALSVLDRINRLLKGNNIRVVLLTLGNDLIELGRKYRPYKHSDSDLGDYSFSDLYIRHPRCYLSREEILRPAANQTSSSELTIWLDAILSEISEDGHSDLLSFIDVTMSIRKKRAATIRKTARDALKRHPDLHTEFYRYWRNNMSAVVLAHSGASQEARRSLERALHSESDRMVVLEEFEAYASKLTEESWNDFFFTAADSGYQLISIADSNRGRRARSVPPLILRNMAEATQIMEYVGSDGDVLRFEEEIHLLLERLSHSKIPEAKYVRSLGFASLFAHGGRWSVSKLLALRAFEDSKRMTGSPEGQPKHGITGREAAYLCAVSHRVTSKEASDLSEPREFIRIAKECLEEEEDFIGIAGVGDNKLCSLQGLTGLRFEAEDIAIDLTEYFFKARELNWELEGEDRLESQLLKSIRRVTRLLGDSGACHQKYLRQSSCITLRGCAFSCFFLLETMDRLPAERSEEMLSMLDEHLDDLAALFFDRDVGWTISTLDLYLTLYAASFSSQPNPILVELNAIYSRIQAEPRGGRGYTIFPFDKQRFSLLEDLIDSR